MFDGALVEFIAGKSSIVRKYHTPFLSEAVVCVVSYSEFIDRDVISRQRSTSCLEFQRDRNRPSLFHFILALVLLLALLLSPSRSFLSQQMLAGINTHIS